MRFTKYLLFAMFAMSCHAKRVGVEPPVVVYERWSYVERPPGTLTVWAYDMAAKEAALKELCQTRTYICHLPPAKLGEVFQIQRTRK